MSLSTGFTGVHARMADNHAGEDNRFVPDMQTLNLPAQDQGGQHLAGRPPMLSKKSARHPGSWVNAPPIGSTVRSGVMDMGYRNHSNDYASSLLDQTPTSITDPYRLSGPLPRYNSAPSTFLQSLEDFHQEAASRPVGQLEYGSLFSDAELAPLNPSSVSGLEHIEADQSTDMMYEKMMVDEMKYDTRLGKKGSPYEQLGSVNGSSKQMMQSVYKPSMDVLHENVAETPQMNTQLSSPLSSRMNSQLKPTMSSSSQIASSMSMTPAMGLLGQQDRAHSGHDMNLGNLTQSLGGDFSGNFNTSSSLPGFGNPRLSNKGNNSNHLLRQSSSPADFLAQLSLDVSVIPGGSKNDKQSLSSPLAHSPDGSLSGGTSEDNSGAAAGPGTPGLIPRMDIAAWEDSQFLSTWDNANFARKRFRDMEADPVTDSFMSDALRSSQDINPAPLARHMSLPTQKSKSTLAVDDLLQSVPCRIRAKRGCATHPRSIAERVRRTKISERMRKLQELVPNMDKQTNTADMLDEAVEYVKHLQRQVQELTESKCKGNCREQKDSTAS